MSAPLVSVIIPTFNRRQTICRSIDSVLSQTYQPLELIVVDDGSTDGTADVLAEYGDKIHLIRQENSGPAGARNRGIAESRGSMIAFLDSDDYWLSDKLVRQVNSLQQDPVASCCLCNCTVVYPNGRTTSTFTIADMLPTCNNAVWLNAPEVLLTRLVIFNQAVLIRHEALQRSGLFDETFRFCEDHDLPFRLSLEGPWILIQDELVVCHAAGLNSWGERALREEIRLRQDQIRLYQRMSQMLASRPAHKHLTPLASYELYRAHLLYIAARLASRRYVSPLGNPLRLILRAVQALFRRSPLYPRVVARRIGWSGN